MSLHDVARLMVSIFTGIGVGATILYIRWVVKR